MLSVPFSRWRECKAIDVIDRLRSCPPARVLRIVAADRGDDETAMGSELSAEEIEGFESELARLREEHRDLDSAIDALERVGTVNQIQVQRLKKRKLYLRDRISQIEDMLTPDIIA